MLYKLCSMYAYTMADKEDLFQEIVILKEKSWTINDGNSSGAPYDRNNNFYLQAVFGIGN